MVWVEDRVVVPDELSVVVTDVVAVAVTVDVSVFVNDVVGEVLAVVDSEDVTDVVPELDCVELTEVVAVDVRDEVADEVTLVVCVDDALLDCVDVAVVVEVVVAVEVTVDDGDVTSQLKVPLACSSIAVLRSSAVRVQSRSDPLTVKYLVVKQKILWTSPGNCVCSLRRVDSSSRTRSQVAMDDCRMGDVTNVSSHVRSTGSGDGNRSENVDLHVSSSAFIVRAIRAQSVVPAKVVKKKLFGIPVAVHSRRPLVNVVAVELTDDVIVDVLEDTAVLVTDVEAVEVKVVVGDEDRDDDAVLVALVVAVDVSDDVKVDVAVVVLVRVALDVPDEVAVDVLVDVTELVTLVETVVEAEDVCVELAVDV